MSQAVVKDKKLTKDFRASEFRCRCRRQDCSAPPPDPAFLIKLQRLRDLWGKPLTVTSGCRCPMWNRTVGGSPVSQHLLGRGADLAVDNPADVAKIAILAEKAGLGGIGQALSFIHVDDGPQGRRWTY